MLFFFLSILPPPKSTRTNTLVPSTTLFRSMTYYGRWTCKFEEAARKGAKAAIIIHDTPGASYGWDVVESSWSGPQYDLRAADDPAPRLQAQRSEEHPSELQSLMRISYAVFRLQKKKKKKTYRH